MDFLVNFMAMAVIDPMTIRPGQMDTSPRMKSTRPFQPSANAVNVRQKIPVLCATGRTFFLSFKVAKLRLTFAAQPKCRPNFSIRNSYTLLVK
jgi:hypothetical protein